MLTEFKTGFYPLEKFHRNRKSLNQKALCIKFMIQVLSLNSDKMFLMDENFIGVM